MKTFSKPLTSAQEKIYLHRCQEGDLDAKNILIERNLRLVAHIAKKYQNSGEDLEDLISIGTIGLIKAISTFDHTRCARLSTYAARCIDNELLMMFRSKKKHSREISLYEPIGTDKEGNEISLLDIIESPPVDIVEEYSTREDIRFLLSVLKDTLSEKEYQVICLRYGLFGIEEQTQREIAAQTRDQPVVCIENREECVGEAKEIVQLQIITQSSFTAAQINKHKTTFITDFHIGKYANFQFRCIDA